MSRRLIIHVCFICIWLCNSILAEGVFAQKEKRSKTENENFSQEEKFILNNFIPKHCLTWPIGKKFVYVGDELNILLQRNDGTLNNDTLSYRNKIFTFTQLSEEQLWDENKYVVLYFDCDGVIYKFDTQKTKSEMTESSYTPLLPNLVDMDMIHKARELLKDSTLYIRTPFWYDENGNKITKRKFVPVKVVDIQAGIPEYNVKFVFTAGDEKKYAIYVDLEPMTQIGRYISFDRIFMFNNPRPIYKDITDDVWSLIINSQVKLGMTKNECRLALGNPTEVLYPYSYGTIKEHWMYETGHYLLFEDGVLSKFRL